MLACRLFGHRHRFRADGAVMRWECGRGCGERGQKAYPDADAAARYAAAFDREDARTLGRRAPFFGLLPLRVWYQIRKRRANKGLGR